MLLNLHINPCSEKNPEQLHILINLKRSRNNVVISIGDQQSIFSTKPTRKEFLPHLCPLKKKRTTQPEREREMFIYIICAMSDCRESLHFSILVQLTKAQN